MAIDTIKANAIFDGAVGNADLASDAVTTAKIADGAITTAKIVDSNITTAKILDANITTTKLADDSITTAKIVDSNITTAKIADSNITTAKIADGEVTAGKLASTLDLSGKTVSLAAGGTGYGRVLQIVQGSTTSLASSTSNSVWTYTNLTASITPSSTSSKILIIGQHGSARIASGLTNGISLRLLRNGTQIAIPVFEFLYSSGSLDAAIPFHLLDSPTTTSPITYTTEFRLLTGASSTAQINPNSVVAVIQLLEIA